MDKGPKIQIIFVGKTKEAWLETALKEYLKRLEPYCRILWTCAKDDIQLTKILQKQKQYICLDASGVALNSIKLANYLEKYLVQWEGEISFVIGGAEGLPTELKKGKPLLSLSSLTFTHQIVRLILLEQIYRGFTIINGLPYHK